MRGPDRPDRFDHLQREPHSVLGVAAVLVVPAVGDRGEELVNEVAVGAVDLQHLEAGLVGPAGGRRPHLYKLFDLAEGQRTGRRIAGVVFRARCDQLPGVPIVYLRGGGQRVPTFPRPEPPGLPSAVAELDAGHGTMLLHEAGKPGKVRDEIVMPKPKITDGSASPAVHLGALDEDEPGTAHGETAHIHQMPIRREAFCAGVLVHRRDDNPVL